MAYISEYYQEFEDAVYAQDADGNYTGYNAQTGKYYYEYCDLNSLVQAYLIQYLSGNSDAFYSSFFFYGVPEKGMPYIYLSDATQGVHMRDNLSDPTMVRQLERSTAFPCPIMLAS